MLHIISKGNSLFIHLKSQGLYHFNRNKSISLQDSINLHVGLPTIRLINTHLMPGLLLIQSLYVSLVIIHNKKINLFLEFRLLMNAKILIGIPYFTDILINWKVL